MGYYVNSISQGVHSEGVHQGRVATVVRFSGNGLRSNEHFETPDLLADRVCEWWFGERHHRMVVLTGGTGQVDVDLIDKLKAWNLFVLLETAGVAPLPTGVDWISVTPRAPYEVKVFRCHELILPYPQDGAHPDRYDGLPADWRWLRPAGPENAKLAQKFCLSHPRWRLAA